MLKCDLCPLGAGAQQVVLGSLYGNTPAADVLVLADAPGTEEDVTGRPLCGKAGAELRFSLNINGISNRGAKLDSLCKCMPPEGHDLTPDEINICTLVYLIPEILAMQPAYIITLGRTVTRFFLGDVNMEMVHGIPRTINFHGLEVVIVPSYHPAAGLHNPEQMILYQSDMQAAGDVIKGKLQPYPPEDQHPKPMYQIATTANMERICREYFKGGLVAVDTEWAQGKPWCLSFSVRPGEAWVIMADQTYELLLLNSLLNYFNVTTIIHNALYDIPVLEKMGVQPRNIIDTMVMAYLLQNEPQGLKPLAYRHCGMSMNTYPETVAVAQARLSGDYLQAAALCDWPTPDPELEWKEGVPRLKQPQAISRKILSLLKKDPNLYYEKWRAMDGIQVVEDVLGPMPEAELCDISFDDAVQYSARDADATLRIYPILWQRIEALGLSDTLLRDMGCMPMVVDMQKNGMPADKEAFVQIGGYFQTRMDELQTRIQIYAEPHFPDRMINPGSSAQMGELLYGALRLRDQGGKFKGKKSKNADSTAEDVLKRYTHLHPVVQDLLDWRGYQKLKTTYSDALAKIISPDGRIRCNIRMTRTATGRFSSNSPNLMAQPSRSEDGRKLRDCYVAPPGRVLISGDFCLVGNTQIITTRGLVPIKDIRIGDGVLSSPGGQTLSIERVSAAACIGIASTYQITLEDGTYAVCTAEHKWMDFWGKLVKTQNLHPGDKMAHVKSGHSGRYPTWYIRNHTNYIKKHQAVCTYHYGPREEGEHADHIDGNIENWHRDNIRYLPAKENFSQGGRRYWRAVKSGDRDDSNRLNGLRIGLKSRRSYRGSGNPNFGKRKGEKTLCANCGTEFYQPPCRKAKFCSKGCHTAYRTGNNHKIARIEYAGEQEVYQITVENTHTYVISNGLISGNSQIEMRCAAHAAQDEKMLQIFRDDLDIHAQTASWMFGIPIDQLDPQEHRYPAKRIGFGVLYMLTAKGLQRELAVAGIHWELERCEDAIQSWFRTYSGIAAFMKANGHFAKRYGYVKDLFGRIRYIPGIRSMNEYIRMEAERQAGNAPIQMGATGIMKEAMRQLVPVYKQFGKRLMPLLPIHDDIVWEADEDFAEEAKNIIKVVMEGAAPADFSIPLKVDFKIGKQWGSMEK